MAPRFARHHSMTAWSMIASGSSDSIWMKDGIRLGNRT